MHTVHLGKAVADSWEEVGHRSDDEDADIMTAVTAIKQTEAQLQSQLAHHITANGLEVSKRRHELQRKCSCSDYAVCSHTVRVASYA